MSQLEKRCMGCMNPLPEGRRQCGICGYPADGENDPSYLRAHTLLSERYMVGRLLQYTGDAALYLGYDVVLKATIRIREFFPNTLSERAEDGGLLVIAGCDRSYAEYLEKFRVHARALARLRELSNIEAVYDIFDANNTAYTIAEYCEGNSLETRLGKAGKLMPWEEARPLFIPLLSTVASLHAAGIYHLGISPQNLILGTDGRLHLQGFCIKEARLVGGDLTPDLIPGYTAPEQYSFGEEVGAAADVYGLAATIFRVVTGNPLPEGSRRAKDSNDLFVPADVAAALPDYVALALFQGLMVNPAQRTQTVQILRDKLSAAPAVSALLVEDERRSEPEEETDDEPEKPRKKSSRTKIAILIVAVVVLIFLVFFSALYYAMFGNPFSSGDKSSTPSTQPSYSESTRGTAADTTAPEQTSPPGTMYSVPNLIGQKISSVKSTQGEGALKVVTQYYNYSNEAAGTIIDQFPKEQQQLEAGGTINVVVSLGPQDRTVPNNLKGQNAALSQAYLEALGFIVEVQRVDPMVVANEKIQKDLVVDVLEQGQTLKAGSKVTLRVSDRTYSAETLPPVDPNPSDPPNDPVDGYGE